MGELLTRGTIWLTIAAYAIGVSILALRGKSQWGSSTRVAWTIACASLIAHFICAFQFYHGWSHETAARETARQTEEVVGLYWAGGLLINYALLLAWIGDVAWWWLAGLESYGRRPWLLLALWHGLLVFILFNATVIFEQGIVRWVGLGVCASLCIAWLLVLRRRLTQAEVTREGN